MATVKQIQSWVKEFFDSGDYERKYKFNKNSNTIVTKMGLRNKLKSTEIRIECHEVYISVRAYVDVRAVKEHRQSVAEYITRVNSENPFCNFNLDFDNGKIWTQTTLICQGMDALPLEAFLRTFYSTASMLEMYGNGLLAVMSDGKPPEEAIADSRNEIGCDCGCDHDHDHDCDDETFDDALGQGGETYGTDFNDETQPDLQSVEEMCLCNKDNDAIMVLEETPNLRRLCMQNSAIDDISVFTNLSKLEEANLCNNEISDLSPLAKLTNLSELRLSNNEINDLSPLANLANLKELCICNNQIDDISPLAGLTALEGLCICFRQIEDISALEGMVNMRQLHLEGNQIDDLSPLAAMVSLEKLSMVNNCISDISPLYGLKNLKHLDLSDNDIPEEQALEFSRRNPDCDIYLVSVDTQ